MHSSRMRTSRSSSQRGGGLPQCMLGYTPPDVGMAPTLGVDQRPPGCGPGTSPPWVWAGRTPPQVWAWRHPPSQTPQLPLWVWACKPARHAGIHAPPRDLLQGMLRYHLQCMLGYHPPMDKMTDMCKNITFANFVCGR